MAKPTGFLEFGRELPMRRPVAGRVQWAVVDRNARKGDKPSDHAPVVVEVSD